MGPIWLFLAIPLALQPEMTVEPVPFDGSAVIRSFNDLADHPRILGVFSPTCATCLQTCADIQQILADHPNSRLRFILLWSPFEPGDNLGTARSSAAAYVSGPEVVHFWDMWKFGSRSYSEELRVPVENAWGLALFFEPGRRWESRAPRPDFWMQSRRLKVGTPFSRKGFERKLLPWLAPEP